MSPLGGAPGGGGIGFSGSAKVLSSERSDLDSPTNVNTKGTGVKDPSAYVSSSSSNAYAFTDTHLNSAVGLKNELGVFDTVNTTGAINTVNTKAPVNETKDSKEATYGDRERQKQREDSMREREKAVNEKQRLLGEEMAAMRQLEQRIEREHAELSNVLSTSASTSTSKTSTPKTSQIDQLDQQGTDVEPDQPNQLLEGPEYADLRRLRAELSERESVHARQQQQLQQDKQELLDANKLLEREKKEKVERGREEKLKEERLIPPPPPLLTSEAARDVVCTQVKVQVSRRGKIFILEKEHAWMPFL